MPCHATILENPNDPTPSMPSTGPWSFGKPNQFANPLPFEHRGFWHPTGRVTFASFSPLTYTWPNSTISLSKLRLQVSSSPSTPQSWIAYATTRTPQPVGLMVNHLFVPVPRFDNTHIKPSLQTNTSSSMETRYTSQTSLLHLLHRLLLAHYKTRSFHLQKKSSNRFGQNWLLGRRRTPSHRRCTPILKNFGQGQSELTMLPSMTTLPTRTLLDSSN